MQDSEDGTASVEGHNEPGRTSDQEPIEEIEKPRAFRPLLLGLGVMAAGVYGTVAAKGAIGSALIDGAAQGTMVIAGAIALVICAIILDAINNKRQGVRMPLAPVMSVSTILLVLSTCLAAVFVQSGGALVGTVSGGLFCMLILAGICGGVGTSLAFSGWHTCVRGASWLYGLIYLILSGIVWWLLVLAVRSISGVIPCAVACIVLIVVGAALMHIQVNVLDEKASN